MKEVSREMYEEDLTQLIEYLSAGTEYRHTTSKLAYQVFKQTEDITIYNNREDVYKIVDKLLPTEDKYRKQDVSKMLNVNYKVLKNKVNMSDKTKEELNKIKQRRMKKK